jgi:predicted phage tail protein
VTGYRIEMSTAAGDFATVAATVTGTEHRVSGLTNGTPYRFRVAAFNSLGEGAMSAASDALTPTGLPSAPTGVLATPADERVALRWVAPATTGGSPITGYRIEMSRDAGPFTTVVEDSGSDRTRRVVRELTNGSSYRFRVLAVTDFGVGPASEPTPDVVPRTVPSAPSSVTAVARAGSASVSWVAPDSTGGSPIVGYRLRASRNGGTFTTVVENTASTALSHRVTGLTSGARYRFRVAAVNDAGVGPSSAPSARIVVR